MPKEKSADLLKRKNISLRKSVIAIGDELVDTIPKSSFSQLLTDLIIEAHNRQTSGGSKSLEQYLIQIVDLLEKNKALEAKLEERAERFKLERKGFTEALALCEEDLKKARSQGA